MARIRRYSLDQSPFYCLRRKARLAEILRIPHSRLRYLVKYSNEMYREWDETKKNGKGIRHIEDPRQDLKKVQARISRILLRISPPEFLFCPVKGRSYIDNGAAHLGKRVVRCLDIQSYFLSTSSEKVKWFFTNVMKCSPDVAWSLIRLSTINGHLPTGSPLSPILAFYANWNLWHDIAKHADLNYVTMTVYIDDVTFSGERVSSSFIWEIKQIMHRNGLRYHKEKSYFGVTSEITGVIVSKEELCLPHRWYQKEFVARKQLDELRHKGCIEDYEKIDRVIKGFYGQRYQVASKQLP